MTAFPSGRSLVFSCVALVAVLTASAHSRAEGAASGPGETCAASAERGQVHQRAGKLRLARQELRACGAAECPALVRTDCLRWLAQVDEELPTVVIRASDARGADVLNVAVYANGDLLTRELDGSALPLDPGRYRMTYERPGAARVEDMVLIRVGEKRRVLAVTFPGPPAESVLTPSSTSPPAAGPNRLVYIFGGLTLASVGAFTFFEVRGQNGYADLEEGCGGTRSCTEDETGSVRTDFALAGTFLAASAVFLGLSAWQYFSGTAKAPLVSGAPSPPRARSALTVSF